MSQHFVIINTPTKAALYLNDTLRVVENDITLADVFAYMTEAEPLYLTRFYAQMSDDSFPHRLDDIVHSCYAQQGHDIPNLM